MDRADLDGVVLEYQDHGESEPVVLIHGGAVADFLAPLWREPTLADHHRVITYHRIGYAGSSQSRPDVGSIGQQAAQCVGLLEHLGVGRAHVVGHSSGGLIAMQMTLEAPEAVATLALLEPVDLEVPSAATLGGGLERAFQRYGAGDREGAIDSFMQAVAGSGYREVVERAVPGAFEQAVKDADTFFGVEAPSGMSWRWADADVSKVTQPVLAVMGQRSPEVSRVATEQHQALLGRFPQAEPYILPDANHLLALQNPRDLAAALAQFFARHPM